MNTENRKSKSDSNNNNGLKYNNSCQFSCNISQENSKKIEEINNNQYVYCKEILNPSKLFTLGDF